MDCKKIKEVRYRSLDSGNPCLKYTADVHKGSIPLLTTRGSNKKGNKTIKDDERWKPKEGNRKFNEQLQDATVLANRVAERTGITYEDVERIKKIDIDRTKKIAQVFEKTKSDPSNKDSKESYQTLIDAIMYIIAEIKSNKNWYSDDYWNALLTVGGLNKKKLSEFIQFELDGTEDEDKFANYYLMR